MTNTSSTNYYSILTNTIQPRESHNSRNNNPSTEYILKQEDKLRTASELVAQKNENLKFLTNCKSSPSSSVKKLKLTFRMSPVTRENFNQRLVNSSSSSSMTCRPIVYTPSESRPPIHVDLNIPGPSSYNLTQHTPNRESIAPSFTFGIRCWPEKNGCSSKSWQKPWFNSTNAWTQKVNFHSENRWPTPSTYKQPDFLHGHPSKSNPASAKFGKAKETSSLLKKGAELEPGPTRYYVESGYNVIQVVPSAVTHKFRTRGTLPWGVKEITPGPSDYSPDISKIKSRSPRASIRRVKTIRFPIYANGPFSPS